MNFNNFIYSDENQSRVISFLRFPLIILVVLIHAKYIGSLVFKGDLIDSYSCPFYNNLSYLFSDLLGSIAVPTFFFISGFLFFYNVSFSVSVYKNKLCSRVKSILIPYVTWNLIVLFFYWACEYSPIHVFPSGMKLISDFTWRDFIYAFWNTQLINPVLPSTGPINPQFWFLRDLMVQMLFSPILYWGVIKFQKLLIYVVGILFLLKLFPTVEGISIQSLFFFSWGAYLSLNKKNIVSIVSIKLRPYVVPSFLISIVFLFYFRNYEWIYVLQNINIVLGVCVFITLSALMLYKNRWRVNSFLSESSFFIYAFHELVLMFLLKLISRFVLPSSDLELVFWYLGSVGCVVLLGLVIYSYLKLNSHFLFKALTGNR